MTKSARAAKDQESIGRASSCRAEVLLLPTATWQHVWAACQMRAEMIGETWPAARVEVSARASLLRGQIQISPGMTTGGAQLTLRSTALWT